MSLSHSHHSHGNEIYEAVCTFSYLLPIGETAEDFLLEINEKVVSFQASVKAKKLSKLLPTLTVRLRKYYKFEGDS